MSNKYSKKHAWEMKKREREMLMQELVFKPYETAKMLYQALGAVEGYLECLRTVDYLSENKYRNEMFEKSVNKIMGEAMNEQIDTLTQKDFFDRKTNFT